MNIVGTDFGNALTMLKDGKRVARHGWNGKGMWLTLITSWNDGGILDTLDYEKLPFIAMKTADDQVVPWLASQTDILARDWVMV